MKVWPALGRRVRDPANGQLLTRRGAEVPDNGYWRRRLAAGDVVDAQPNAQPTAPAAAPAKPARTRAPQPPKSTARKDPA